MREVWISDTQAARVCTGIFSMGKVAIEMLYHLQL